MSKLKTERKGEQRCMKNGQMAKIIEYNGVNDITIQFEDKTIVKHRAYKAFKAGEIKNPNIKVINRKSFEKERKDSRVGTVVRSTEGINMEIIRYQNAHNVDVKFENGVVLLKRSYFHFKNGQIKMPTIFPNGIHVIEFAYRKGNDWYYICEKPEWEEQKILPMKEICPEPIQISKNITERRTIYGSLKNQTTTASNGMQITCIDDNGSKDITVKFEDGEVVYHQRRESFLAGHIRHPSKKVAKTKRDKNKHKGEVYYDCKGRKMTIVEYYSNSNVTIEYEDGVRLENKEYRIIKKGADLYPKTRVGETKKARNGMNMTIIKDKIWHDVHIQFEDGTIVKGCTHSQFDSGAVKYPNENGKSLKHRKERIGEKKRMKNGLIAEIIDYRNAKDMDVRFENGLVSEHRDWNSFLHSRLGMPKTIGKLRIKEFAYRVNDDWYYIVGNEEWKEDRIMSVKEMYDFNKD